MRPVSMLLSVIVDLCSPCTLVAFPGQRVILEEPAGEKGDGKDYILAYASSYVYAVEWYTESLLSLFPDCLPSQCAKLKELFFIYYFFYWK